MFGGPWLLKIVARFLFYFNSLGPPVGVNFESSKSTRFFVSVSLFVIACVCVIWQSLCFVIFVELLHSLDSLHFLSGTLSLSLSLCFAYVSLFFTISTPFFSTSWAIFSTPRNQFSPRFNFFSFFSYSRVCPLMGCLRKLVLGLWESLPGKWRNGGQRLLLGFNHSMHTHINPFVTYTNIY